jgi:hypothetical protein
MMEWRSKEKKNIKYPKHNDSRVRRTFLLFPKTLKGITKWLCFVKIGKDILVIQDVVNFGLIINGLIKRRKHEYLQK